MLGQIINRSAWAVKSGLAAAILIGFMVAAASGQAQQSHRELISDYTGPETCLACHAENGLTAVDSVHYQWRGDSSQMIDPPGPQAGKSGALNDFCGQPDINWLGLLTTATGTEAGSGCAQCHVGLGAKPSGQISATEAANVDCLVCHSDIYVRKVVRNGDGFAMVPDPDNMTVSPTEAAQGVVKPTTKACLNCHAKAAGGNNWKRGDLSLDQLNPSRDHDVHLAAEADGGAGLGCRDCHVSAEHRIAGRGSDLRPRDLEEDMSCARCHTDQPHDSSQINRHLGRVDCTTCHIPTFSKSTPTEMVRDWTRTPVYSAEKGLYEPPQEMQSNVTPTYRWFNGKSVFYNFGEQPAYFEGQAIVMSAPDGRVDDGQSKLHPFKIHRAKWPRDPGSGLLLPMKMSRIFQDADVNQAIIQGTTEAGWEYTSHVFADTVRYMGLFHEVRPRSAALGCTDCHYGASRIDFNGLGYTPRGSDPGSALCLSCHGNQSDEFEGGNRFDKIHREHVSERGYDCSTCHDFRASSTQPTGGGGGGDDDDERDDD